MVKAGLADTLSNGGPFTVVAPTNEAFAKLPADLVKTVTSDVELLKKVIQQICSLVFSQTVCSIYFSLFLSLSVPVFLFLFSLCLIVSLSLIFNIPLLNYFSLSFVLQSLI